MKGGEKMQNVDNMPKTYLGDGVYAFYDGFGYWLYANDANNPTDKVYLEPVVFNALLIFIEECRKMKGE